MSTRIGFIGLGVMGNAMAINLLRRDHLLTAFTRSGEYSPELLEAGARIAASPSELASHSNVVLVMVSDAAACESVLFGPEGAASRLKAGSLVIIFSTISPAQARTISAKLEANGISCLDAPVSGGDVGAKNATLTIMVGGKKSDFETAQPLLQCLGKQIEYMGPSGSGQMMKAINQVAVALAVGAMTESLVLAKKSGLQMDKAHALLAGGAGGSWALQNYAPRVLRGDLKPGFAAKHMLKDLHFVAEETEVLGLELPLTELVTKLYGDLCETEAAELGNHALIKLYS